jgi:protein TonB
MGEPLMDLDMRSASDGSTAGRIVRLCVVVLLHVGVIAFLLSVQPRMSQDTGLLRMDVRTVVQEFPKVEPPKPEVVPPKPLPQAIRRQAAPPPPAAPVMTAAPEAPSSVAFQVAPQPAVPAPAPVVAPATAALVSPAAAPAPMPVTAARFDADYLRNPPPAYPAMSRRLREEGRVLLLVRVSPQGHAESVQVRQTSGFERLDEAGLAAVRQWRFVPARRGDEPVAATVLVPLVFKLE